MLSCSQKLFVLGLLLLGLSSMAVGKDRGPKGRLTRIKKFPIRHKASAVNGQENLVAPKDRAGSGDEQGGADGEKNKSGKKDDENKGILSKLFGKPKPRAGGGGLFDPIDVNELNVEEPMPNVPEELEKMNDMFVFCERCRKCGFCSSSKSEKPPTNIPPNEIIMTTGEGRSQASHITDYFKQTFAEDLKTFDMMPLRIVIWWCAVTLSVSSVALRLCNCADNSPRLVAEIGNLEKIFLNNKVVCSSIMSGCTVTLNTANVSLTALAQDDNPPEVYGNDQDPGMKYVLSETPFEFKVKTYSVDNQTFYTVGERTATELINKIFDNEPPEMFKFIGHVLNGFVTNQYDPCLPFGLERPATGFKEYLDWPIIG